MAASREQEAKVDAVLAAVRSELLRAMAAHKPFASEHEGYAVILEELDELWDEVKRRDRDDAALRDEAVQVAAMAVRFVVDRVAD